VPLFEIISLLFISKSFR